MRRRRHHVLFETRKHGVVLARPFVRALVLAGGGIALAVWGSSAWWPLAAGGAIAAVAGALVALRAVVAWDRTKVVLEEGELAVVHGVLRRRRASVELSPTAPLEVEQSILGRVLGYGTVIAGDLEIPHVPDPRRLRGFAR
jgi:uncharacterized membrane protein YdbT with pleckstrin-like domain